MFLRHYQAQLRNLRELAAGFADTHPTLAPMLLGTRADPDVERVLEGVAFLTALTGQKLDDEFPEFTQELIDLLLPHVLRPLPASTLVTFEPDTPPRTPIDIPGGTDIASAPVDGTACRFTTTCALRVTPLRIDAVTVRSAPASPPGLELRFSLQGIPLQEWGDDTLRLFLSSGYEEGSCLLLLLARHVRDVHVSAAGTQPFRLGRDALRFPGFTPSLVPGAAHDFCAHRIVQEFLCLPEKFLYVDVHGLQHWHERGHSTAFTLHISLDAIPPWLPPIDTTSFMLHVVPAVNLFDLDAEPIDHQHRAVEYRVEPAGTPRAHYTVHDVTRVSGWTAGEAQARAYLPFRMHPHDTAVDTPTYRVTRRATAARGCATFISLQHPPHTRAAPEILSLRLRCTNGHLPEALGVGDLSVRCASSPDRMRFANIRPIAPGRGPPLDEGLLWRLLSHLHLNLQSLADAARIRDLLSLYLPGADDEHDHVRANRRRIEGLEGLRIATETRLVGRGGIRRGQAVTLRCRSDHFAGMGDLFVFGSVLERLLGDCAALGAFIRVELEDPHSGNRFQWPPRIGNKPLI